MEFLIQQILDPAMFPITSRFCPLVTHQLINKNAVDGLIKLPLSSLDISANGDAAIRKYPLRGMYRRVQCRTLEPPDEPQPLSSYWQTQRHLMPSRYVYEPVELSVNYWIRCIYLAYFHFKWTAYPLSFSFVRPLVLMIDSTKVRHDDGHRQGDYQH